MHSDLAIIEMIVGGLHPTPQAPSLACPFPPCPHASAPQVTAQAGPLLAWAASLTSGSASALGWSGPSPCGYPAWRGIVCSGQGFVTAIDLKVLLLRVEAWDAGV